jgi:hypothetical protein
MSTNELGDVLRTNQKIYLRIPNSIHPYTENGIFYSGFEQVVIPRIDGMFDVKDRKTKLYIEQNLTYEQAIRYIITQSVSNKLQAVFHINFIPEYNLNLVNVQDFCLEYIFHCIKENARK